MPNSTLALIDIPNFDSLCFLSGSRAACSAESCWFESIEAGETESCLSGCAFELEFSSVLPGLRCDTEDNDVGGEIEDERGEPMIMIYVIGALVEIKG